MFCNRFLINANYKKCLFKIDLKKIGEVRILPRYPCLIYVSHISERTFLIILPAFGEPEIAVGKCKSHLSIVFFDEPVISSTPAANLQSSTNS